MQAIKQLTTGDGGLLFCPNKKTYEKAKLLRWFGIDREVNLNKKIKKSKSNKIDSRLEKDVKNWGYKFHMNDINATIGISNLKNINKIINKNKNNAKFLFKNLNNLKGLSCLNPISHKYESSYWLFTIKVKNKNKFINYMLQNKIIVSQVHKRNDLHTCFKSFRTILPNLDKIEKEMICIPCGWWLERKDLQNIVNKIKFFLKNK